MKKCTKLFLTCGPFGLSGPVWFWMAKTTDRPYFSGLVQSGLFFSRSFPVPVFSGLGPVGFGRVFGLVFRINTLSAIVICFYGYKGRHYAPLGLNFDFNRLI